MRRALKAMLTMRSDINGDDNQTAYATEAQVQRYDWELNELLMQTMEHQNRTKILIKRTESLLILETTIVLCSISSFPDFLLWHRSFIIVEWPADSSKIGIKI